MKAMHGHSAAVIILARTITAPPCRRPAQVVHDFEVRLSTCSGIYFVGTLVNEGACILPRLSREPENPKNMNMQ